MRNYNIPCYIKTSTGKQHFNSIPSNTYFLAGIHDVEDFGKATVFTTELQPLLDSRNNLPIYFPEFAGKEFSECVK